MDWLSAIFIILGLCVFEIVMSIDNAVINAEVLKTMSMRARRWFLLWGIIFAVFIVRGFLPWIIIWVTNPTLGFFGSFTAAFSSNPLVMDAVAKSAPVLLMGGGVFLFLLFLHWLFLEEKEFGLSVEKKLFEYGIWFYAVASVFLCLTVWFSLKINPMVTFGAVIGSTTFFITQGFKENAEDAEKKLLTNKSKGFSADISKILYLEVIDATFSVDGVLGAFAFTLIVPLIIIGNGLGAFVVRELTVRNIEVIKKYKYLKNGAMYSIFFLGLIMVFEGFGHHIPFFVSPLITFAVIGYFLYRSHISFKTMEKALSTSRKNK